MDGGLCVESVCVCVSHSVLVRRDALVFELVLVFGFGLCFEFGFEFGLCFGLFFGLCFGFG